MTSTSAIPSHLHTFQLLSHKFFPSFTKLQNYSSTCRLKVSNPSRLLSVLSPDSSTIRSRDLHRPVFSPLQIFQLILHCYIPFSTSIEFPLFSSPFRDVSYFLYRVSIKFLTILLTLEIFRVNNATIQTHVHYK